MEPQRRRSRATAAAAAPVREAVLSTTPLRDLDQTIPSWPGRRVKVGDRDIFVRTTPARSDDAEPALYVHGLGGASTNWTDLADLLSPFVAGEALDLPGFGRSGPAPSYSLTAHAQVVIDYLEQRGPVHLFGNSMGGAISIMVAARRPDLVRTLTLISPAVSDLRPRRGGADPRMLALIVPGVGPLLQRRLETLPAKARVRVVLELCFADPSIVPAARFEEAVEELQARAGLRWTGTAMAHSLRSIVGSYLGARSTWARLAKITAPTLVVWGTEDRLVSSRLAPRVARAIPDSRLLLLPHIGHVAQMEDPVTTARAVLGLLEDSRRAGSVQRIATQSVRH